jgi:sugar/nucleoside kinase (ribokinase family)
MRQARDRALFVGLSTLDLGYLVEGYPAENTKNLAVDAFMAAGGPATNAAVTCAFLTGEAGLVTALGRHALALVVHEELQARNVSVTDVLPLHDGPPPVSAITISRSSASRTIVSLDGSRLPALPDLPAATGRAGLVLVDGHLPALAVAAARRARAAGIPVVLDGGRWRPEHDGLLRLVDVAICSRSFCPPGLEGAAAQAIHEDLHDRGVPLVATTDGPAPVRFSTPKEEGEIAVPSVTAVDTLGAGDILHGAFAAYFGAGCDFADALDRAAVVAAASCRFFGTRAWMGIGRSALPG